MMGAMKSFSFTAAITAVLGTAYLASAQCVVPAAAAAFSYPFVLTNSCLLQSIPTELTNGGRAEFSFTVASTGRYALAVMAATTHEGGAIFVNIDAEPVEPAMKYRVPVSESFTNCIVSASGRPRFFDLESGTHRVIIRGSSANVRISQIAVLSRPAPPTNLHIVASPN